VRKSTVQNRCLSQLRLTITCDVDFSVQVVLLPQLVEIVIGVVLKAALAVIKQLMQIYIS